MLKQFAKFDISGRLANDPDLTFQANAKALVKFAIFVNQYDSESDFIPIVAWENTAKYIKDHLEKGDAVHLKGFIKSKFSQKEGGKKLNPPDYVVTEVIAYEKKKGENYALPREH